MSHLRERWFYYETASHQDHLIHALQVFNINDFEPTPEITQEFLDRYNAYFGKLSPGYEPITFPEFVYRTTPEPVAEPEPEPEPDRTP